MDENKVPYLCGGTFYILLLQALKKDRRIRINDLDGFGAKEKAINDVTCLKGLVRTFYSFNENYSESTFTAHKDHYKFCRKNSTDWLQFEDGKNVEAFDDLVKKDYASALAAMNTFIDAYIDDGDFGKKLVRALLEVIDSDKSIEDQDIFYIQAGQKTISKAEMLQLRHIDARPFLLAVWHFIIVNRGSKNTGGAATANAWLISPGKQAPRKYVGTVGDNYAQGVGISFDRWEADPVDDAPGSTEEEQVSEEEPTVETAFEEENKNEEQTVHQTLTAGVVVNQHAEKIVNIGHVDHLEI